MFFTTIGEKSCLWLQKYVYDWKSDVLCGIGHTIKVKEFLYEQWINDDIRLRMRNSDIWVPFDWEGSQTMETLWYY